MKPIFATISLCLLFLVTGSAMSTEREAEKRRFVATAHYTVVNDRPDPPVFEYRGPRGHHGQMISKQPVRSVTVWADGTIVWEIQKVETYESLGWFHSTIPAENVEKAVQAIIESTKRYPIENRPFFTNIILIMSADYSPHVMVMAPDLNEWSPRMEDALFRYYIKKRDDFRSDDEEKILHAIMELNHSFIKYATGLVNYYRRLFPNAGLSKPGDKTISNEELKKCAELFAADAEHLLVMEKQVLDLVPSHEGLTPKKSDGYKSQDVKVDQETVDGKRRFVYSPITKEEKEKVLEERRKQREKP